MRRKHEHHTLHSVGSSRRRIRFYCFLFFVLFFFVLVHVYHAGTAATAMRHDATPSESTTTTISSLYYSGLVRRVLSSFSTRSQNSKPGNWAIRPISVRYVTFSGRQTTRSRNTTTLGRRRRLMPLSCGTRVTTSGYRSGDFKKPPLALPTTMF